EYSQTLIASHRRNPAWQLLAARRAPLVIGSLQVLFDAQTDGVSVDGAEQRLAEMLAEHANADEYRIEGEDFLLASRKELREWIKRGLIVERDGRILATDALQQVFQFVDGLQNRFMTSTASRLATVQREIESLETRLNPDPQSRADHIRRRIRDLEFELSQVEAGNMEVLDGTKAIEGIREVYNLAMSLRANFRRVEDSYREADRHLRQSIVSEHHHRGNIVDKLLDSHDNLLET